MKRLNSLALFTAALVSGLAFGQGDAFDHLSCTDTETNRKQCAIKQSVLFENGAENKVDYESNWTIKVKSPCGSTNTSTYMFITADSQVGGKTINLGTEEVHTVIGRGPVVLFDRNPDLTRFWTLDKSCRLSFELLSKTVSAGQKKTWTDAAGTLTAELQGYLKIIQRRTTVLNYAKKRDDGDQSIYKTLEDLISFYKTRAENGDLAAEFMQIKLEEVRDGVPVADIQSDFEETAKVGKVALKQAKDVRDLMAANQVEVPVTLTETIAKAETMF